MYYYYVRTEQKRLEQKLSFDLIKSVYFQIGVNREKLRQGLSFIRTLNKDLALYGECIIPNPTLFEKLQTGPWHGVTFDEVYLHNLKHAEEETRKLEILYNQYNITPLLLVMPFTRENLLKAQPLIS